MSIKYILIAILCVSIVHGYTLPGHTVKGNIDMYGNKVLNSTTPLNDSDLVTKGYADGLIGGSYLNLTGGTLTGWLNLSSIPLLSVGTPVNDTDASTKKYVDDSISGIPSFNGGTITNQLNLNSLPLVSVGTPVNNSDASTKKYVDDKAALYLPLAGGTMSGQVNFGTKPLLNIGAPVNNTDASTKKYVDDNSFSPTKSFYFTGSTGEELEDFIIANGEGHYYLESLVNITEELTISTQYVVIHGTSNMWMSRTDDGPWISVDMASGRAINITCNYVTLDHITAISSNPDSTAVVITLAGYYNMVDTCTIQAKKGVGIELIGSPFYYNIKDTDIGLTADSVVGTCILSTGGGTSVSFHGWISGGLLSGGAYGIYFVEGCSKISDVYLLEHDVGGIVFIPAVDYDTGDTTINDCVMDFIEGPGLYITGGHATKSISVHNCWFYTDTAEPAIWVKNIVNLIIDDCPMIYSTGDHGLYFDSLCNGVTISDNYIYAPATSKIGVLVTDQASNTNFIIANNRAYGQAYGIGMGATKCNHWTIIGNAASITSGSASATKILEHNRV